MPVTVNTNLFSINAQKNLARTQGDLTTAMQRLSSGLRINMAKDDAAGLAVATRMDAQARGLTVAERNANDAISLLQVADNALQSMSGVLQRMRELAVQSANGTYSNADRTLMNAEFEQLRLELDRIATQAQFNNIAVLDPPGAATSQTFTFQVGANAGETIAITLNDGTAIDATTDAGTTTAGYTMAGGIDTVTDANDAIIVIDVALDSLNTQLATVGASQSRLENVISNLRAMQEAQRAAYSRIMDADFAAETARMTRAQILQQAGVSTLAQANTIPQLALNLLQ